MIEYIYIVKCPGCEDEMFNFFTDARMQCDLLMSKKPSITQVEVERNDFGECTDSHDLGTVWSWEEAMKDTEGGYTDAEPAKSIFTKDDLKPWIEDEDPEFDNLDNSVDYEELETSEVSPVERKPIPEGMTIEQLVEEMEENEDTVECTLCNDLFDKSTCRKELNLGWLCRRCADDLVARGEGPVFKEDNYWDFLDEDIEKPVDEDLEWHTYKITFSTKANPDSEQTTTFKTWQSDVEYAWRMSNANIPHTTVKNIELVEEVEELHDLGSTYDGGYPEEKPELPEIPEVSDPYLKLCPECGKETFDIETGICVECGFN